MGKTRVWTLGVVLILSVAATGCTHLVHEHEIAGIHTTYDTQLADHESRITTLESDVSGIRNDIDELRRRLTALETNFGAHIIDEDLHCPCGLAIALPIHFDFNSDAVRAVDQPILDAFAASVTQSLPDAMVTVEGFTDAFGSEAANRRLAERRAGNVRDYLLAQGMNADNVRVDAIGERSDRLINDETGVSVPQSGIENRRVTFVLEWAGPGTAN